MSPSQVESGHAFEYGIACAFQRIIKATLQEDAVMVRARNAFVACSETEQRNIALASDEIAAFLVAHDKGLQHDGGYTIRLQADMSGASGDVRDVIISRGKDEIGVSAKNRHTAVKHSRLSEKIDFGYKWFGIRCHPEFFHQIVPVFRELKTLQRRGEKWRNLENKIARFYIPVLNAFKDEIVKLCLENPAAPKSIVEYMLGKNDFYKIIKENGDVTIQSFNLRGTLGWGPRLRLPSRLIEAREKDGVDTTLILTFDEGWQLSFRIHNAESKVIPSMKFDVQIIGKPSAGQHTISYLHG